jgi:hypothetical protein
MAQKIPGDTRDPRGRCGHSGSQAYPGMAGAV